MNRIVVGDHLADDELFRMLMRAVRDFSQWQDVLAHIMLVTKAKAAMITLRDSQTCQIVDDLALETSFHSPLICGFSEQDAIFYLQELREKDPWAEAQRLQYPHFPVLMSSICNPHDYTENKFFPWLNDLGLQESVVCELDRMSGHWSAFNLFFEKPNSTEALSALCYLERHLKLFRDAWKTSQELVHNIQSRQITLEQITSPACIVNQSAEVLSHNCCFSTLLKNRVVKLLGPKKRLSIADSISIENHQSLILKEIGYHDFDGAGLQAFTASFAPDPLHKDKRDGHHLLVFRNPHLEISSASFSEIKLGALTFQEKKMLKAVQSGLSVRRSGEKVGIKRTRAFEVWASVKSKLAITSSHQVRGSN